MISVKFVDQKRLSQLSQPLESRGDKDRAIVYYREKFSNIISITNSAVQGRALINVVTHDSRSTCRTLADSWMWKAVRPGVRHDWTEGGRLASWTLSSFSSSSSLQLSVPDEWTSFETADSQMLSKMISQRELPSNPSHRSICLARCSTSLSSVTPLS